MPTRILDFIDNNIKLLLVVDAVVSTMFYSAGAVLIAMLFNGNPYLAAMIGIPLGLMDYFFTRNIMNNRISS